MPPWDTILQIFGPLAAVVVVLWFVFKYMKPRLDAADEEKSRRIAALEEEVKLVQDQREAAKDSVIAAFGDIGDGFEQMAQDVRALFENHEGAATDRHEVLLVKLEEHKDEIISKLERHQRDVSGQA